MNVTIYGTGYVGLVTGACLADAGHNVMCMDVDADKIAKLKEGIIPIFEPGLEGVVKENYKIGHLHFTCDLTEAVKHGQIQFIAVGTPPDEDGSADLKYVRQVASNIATHMQEAKIIITKSTVPVGTSDIVREAAQRELDRRGSSLSFAVASNPEFLKEGAAVADFMKPDRIVVGIAEGDEATREAMRELYAPFNRNHDRLIFMDIRSAELTKYAANAMLATKISFMNEIANIAEHLGADVEQVRRGIGSDPRIGYQFIYPGCGYGGSCFPKDVQALHRTARQFHYQSDLLEAVENVNARQKRRLFELLLRHYGDLQGKTIALWGLAFKPRTDDMREAPSRVLMEALWEAGAKVQAYDPEAMDECQRIYGEREDLMLMGTKETVLRGADALVICTEWQHFRAPDFELLKNQLRDQVIFDGRNLYDPDTITAKGLTYYGIGRGSSVHVPKARTDTKADAAAVEA